MNKRVLINTIEDIQDILGTYIDHLETKRRKLLKENK